MHKTHTNAMWALDNITVLPSTDYISLEVTDGIIVF